MARLAFTLTLTLCYTLLSTLTAAQCPACDTYNAALTSCKSSSADVNTVGSDLNTDTIHCMCQSKCNDQTMLVCSGCDADDLNSNLNNTILTAWLTTCEVDDIYGDQQATLCWKAQPGNYGPCSGKTGGIATDSGSGGSSPSSSASGSSTASASTSGSSTTASAASGKSTVSSATAGTSTSNSQSTATSPSSATAKSEGMTLFGAPGLLSVMAVGLGVLIDV